jgi:hypothetical protein
MCNIGPSWSCYVEFNLRSFLLPLSSFFNIYSHMFHWIIPSQPQAAVWHVHRGIYVIKSLKCGLRFKCSPPSSLSYHNHHLSWVRPDRSVRPCLFKVFQVIFIHLVYNSTLFLVSWCWECFLGEFSGLHEFALCMFVIAVWRWRRAMKLKYVAVCMEETEC